MSDAIDWEWPKRITERRRFNRIWEGVTLPDAPEPDDRWLTAAHEAAHAVCDVLLFPDVSLVVSIRAGAGHKGVCHRSIPDVLDGDAVRQLVREAQGEDRG